MRVCFGSADSTKSVWRIGAQLSSHSWFMTRITYVLR